MQVRYLLIMAFAASLALMLPPTGTFSQEPAATEAAAQGVSVTEPEALSNGQHTARAAQLRAEIRAILNRPEFKFAGQGESRPVPEWLQWLRRAWDSMWNRISETGQRIGEDAPWLMVVLLAIAAAVMLILIWRVISESFFERRGTPAGRRDMSCFSYSTASSAPNTPAAGWTTSK